MVTYVVNMLKDVEKRLAIEAQLKLHPELNYRIWRAVEGRKLTENEQKEKVLPMFYTRYGTNATLPAIGCSLSHIAIYQDIVSSNTKYALVLEDDAILSEKLYLESLVKLLDVQDPVAILLTPEFWYKKNGDVFDIDQKHSVYELDNGFMTSGYLINYSAAKLLLSKIYPVQYTADAWSDFVGFGLNLYGIVPHVISYPDGRGEIGKSQIVPKSTFLKMRAFAVWCYVRILNFKKYINGNRKSKKIWR